ncbi:hypothetical protein ACFX2C_011175 [Malus domestica]
MATVTPSLVPLLFFARISGFAVAALVIFWAFSFKSSFLPHSSPQEDQGLIYSALHPLFMVIGFILISGEAILIHRWLPGSRSLKKSVHLCLQGVALASGIVGIWTKFQGKKGMVANFYSLHSWMGLICILLFGAQWLMGFLSFWHRGEVRAVRLRVLPWHIFLGLYTYGLAVATAETGLLEKLTFLQTKRNVSKHCTESMLVNSLGLGLALVSGIRNLDISWFPSDQSDDGDYGGWEIVDSPLPRRSPGLPKIVIVGIGASLAVIVAAIAHFSRSKRGFKFQITSPLHSVHGMLSRGSDTESANQGALDEDAAVTEASPGTVPVVDSDNVTSAYVEKLERIIIPVAVDSTQQEALAVLKKLKIIEDDVKADELCTRREYARWLVQLNSSLERNAKHRLVPSVSLAGSIISAFDDVFVEDPDFGSIQALAEAGVIPSKLSQKSSSYDGLNGYGNINFSPERFISRQDLIDWKAHLEYDFLPGVIEKISTTTTVGFMDVKGMSSDAPAGLYIDMLTEESSILRKVFGQCKRLQPNKPSTKAQAAVALTSGRIAESVACELLRIKAENSARKAEMEVTRSELLDREDIQKFWDEKMNAEKAHGLEVENAYLAALQDLEQEKIFQEKNFAEMLKEKAAMDSQRHLLLSLKEEVNEMSEKLASERSTYVAERCDLQDTLNDLETKQESMLDTKSILEAEIEAIRILRSWVEDEARKSQARAKVLEEVGQRWKWNNQAP